MIIIIILLLLVNIFTSTRGMPVLFSFSRNTCDIDPYVNFIAGPLLLFCNGWEGHGNYSHGYKKRNNVPQV